MDHILNDGFESITQLLLEQKKNMERLEAENRELRRQLADLRNGIGISLLIEGKSISLRSEQDPPVTGSYSAVSAPGYAQTRRTTDKQPAAASTNIDTSWQTSLDHSPLADSFIL